jgi:superfamily II DNA or RNA helicase
VAEQFTKAGISVGIYTSNTSIQNRQILLNKLDNHEITILISVAALSKGFDRQYIECILDLRPLRRSLAEYVQMIGRGIRSYPDKKSCLLLDFTGNFKRFAYDFERVFNNGVNSLDESERLHRIRKDNETDLTIHCPSCGYENFVLECIKCNYIAKPIDMPARKHITVDVKDIVAIPVTIPPSPLSKNSLIDKAKKLFNVFRL